MTPEERKEILKDLESVREEMSLSSKAPAPAAPSWRDLWTYKKEIHPTFHTIEDYRAALRLFILRYPKVRESLADWHNN
jgi:hypothetical protein